ncbi:MAG: hypothetical protein OXU20_27900 [Myxococcales bacterium]|nr:hypothetical protein [Myxococcales bacterium]
MGRAAARCGVATLTVCVFPLLDVGCSFDNEESPAASPGSDLEASLPTSRNPTSSHPASPDEGPSPTESASTMPQASGTAGTGRGADGPARATPAQAPPQNRAPSTADPSQTVAPNTQLDPTVEFEWPEWQSDEEDSCRGGTYTGTFRCTFTDATGLLVVQLEGPVSLTFVKSMDGEFLEITDGHFDAIANLIIGASATIQGRLDCGTLMLRATAVDGAWAFGDPDLPLLPGGALAGDITGTLDPGTGELAGEWTFGDPDFGLCPGSWSVRYQP